MAQVNIVNQNKEYYYDQFVQDFNVLPRIVKNACGNSLVLPLLFKQIQHDYEFVRDAGSIYDYKLISNKNIIAQINDAGFKRLLLPELRVYKNNDIDYVLGTNWVGNLVDIDLPNLEISADSFLRYTFDLKCLYAPKWRIAGNYTLFCKKGLMSVLDAPQLRKVGQYCNPLVYETVKRNTKKQK